MKKCLNVGCGADIKQSTQEEEWFNVDANPALANLSFVCDMTDIIANDCSYDYLRCSHVVEHCTVEKAKQSLAEWFRVLKNNGEIFIDTPNFERTAQLYMSGCWQSDFASLTLDQQKRCSLNGAPHKMLWAAFKVFSTELEFDQHFMNYDADLLSQMMHDAGFRNIRVVQTDPSLIVVGVAVKDVSV